MNILILSPFFPWPLDQGGRIRVYNLVKHLSRNHRVTLACLSPDTAPDCGPLTDLCDEVVVIRRNESFSRNFARFLLGGEAFNCARFSSGTFVRRLSVLAARKRYDLVQIEFSMFWQYAHLFPGIPVSLDAHNIEYRNVQQIGEGSKSLLKRWLYRLETSRLKAAEERSWRECTLCFAVSERERDEIAVITNDPSKIVTVPNGVDLERFAFRPRSGSGRNILFLGGLDYIPNLDAARWFLSDIFPLILQQEPETELLMVGRELWRIGDQGSGIGIRDSIEFHENVAEVLPWFYEADMLVVPLRQGAGTRIKVLEAMAAGLPVVSTSKGCEGIGAVNGEHLLVADTPAEFATAAVKIFGDAELGRRLADAARRLVEERYTWEKAVAVMEEGYQNNFGMRERGTGIGTRGTAGYTE